MTLRQRTRFYQQLAVLTRAGLPMRTSLQRLRERISGPTLDVLAEKIGEGQPVGDAFTAAGFSPFECHLVAAGERSAQLDTVFERLGEFWARQGQMVQALTSQLYYPLVVFVLSLLVNALVDTIFHSWPYAAVHLVETAAYYAAAAFVIYTLVRVSWSSDVAQRFWLALPIIGRTLSTACAYRWVTAVKLEYGAGVPMPDAVADAWRASGYAGRERLAEEGRAALREGAELSTLVQHWRQLPRDWVDFIETGEISGALEAAFSNLEDEAGRAWAAAQKRMTEWTPKIFYFLLLLAVAANVLASGAALYRQTIGGSFDALNSVLGP